MSKQDWPSIRWLGMLGETGRQGVTPIGSNRDFLAYGSPQDFSTTSPNAGLQGQWEECRELVGMHITLPDMLVNVCGVVFRWIFAQVLLTGLIINLKYCCVSPSNSQMYLISIAWEHCCLIVLLMVPTVVVF